jgi:hypothetical protein
MDPLQITLHRIRAILNHIISEILQSIAFQVIVSLHIILIIFVENVDSQNKILQLIEFRVSRDKVFQVFDALSGFDDLEMGLFLKDQLKWSFKQTNRHF